MSLSDHQNSCTASCVGLQMNYINRHLHMGEPGALGPDQVSLPIGISERGSGLTYSRLFAAHAPRPTLQVCVHMQLHQRRKVCWQKGRHLQPLVPQHVQNLQAQGARMSQHQIPERESAHTCGVSPSSEPFSVA